MKNKLYQPMETSQALSFIASNQYDTPRKLICAARALAANICAAYDPEMTDMLLDAIHNEDYVLVYGMIVQAYGRLKEQLPEFVKAIAGYQPVWEMFLLFVTEEVDDLEDLLGDLFDVVGEKKWQRQALRELMEKEARK